MHSLYDCEHGLVLALVLVQHLKRCLPDMMAPSVCSHSFFHCHGIVAVKHCLGLIEDDLQTTVRQFKIVRMRLGTTSAQTFHQIGR